MYKTAVQFGTSLDNDDYKTTLSTLTPDCIYDMGSETLTGAEAIVNSYEQNMLAGRKKMDKLEWGNSYVDQISDSEYIVNFTDYLYHAGEKFTFQCQQRLFINQEQKIYKIEHIHDPNAWQDLQDWYRSVGIPTSK